MSNIPSEIRNTGRLDKIPAWARDLIQRLDRELTSATEQRDQLYRTIGEPSGLGRDFTALRVPKEKYLHAATDSWTDAIRVRFEAGQVEITGNGPLLIKTNASNAVTISEAGR